MTFRTRLVLATTVAVVVAVLAASLGSFLVARHTLLNAADSSLQTAAREAPRRPGDRLHHRHARPGDRHHGRRRLWGRPPGDRAGAAGRRRPGAGVLHHGGRGRERDARVRRASAAGHAACRTASWSSGGALQIATLLNVDSELKKLALLLGAVAFAGRGARHRPGLAGGPDRAGPAQLAHRHGRGPGRDDRRDASALARAPRRARAPPTHLQPPPRGARVVPARPEPAGARRLARAAHAAHQPAHQSRGDPPGRRAQRRGPFRAGRRRPGAAAGADRHRGGPGRAGPG